MPGESDFVTVTAASSLQPLLDSTSPEFETANSINLRITYAASGAASRQIEQGAPVDVFISAGEQYVDNLLAGGFLRQDSIVIFGHGDLSLIRPQKTNNGNLSFQEAQRIAIPNPEIAPYGAAAKRLLEQSKLWDDIEPHIVYAQSALHAFQFTKAGEVDYALVPKPLLQISDSGVIEVASQDAGLLGKEIVTYSAAVTTSSAKEASARAFVKYLASPTVEAWLTELGYRTLEQPVEDKYVNSLKGTR